MLTERAYEYLSALKRYGNLTKAAEALYISQPALTQYVNRLEKSLGVVLLDRQSTPIKFTTYGTIYMDYATRFHTLQLELCSQLQHMVSKPSRISIGIPFNLQPLLSDVLLIPLLRKYPEIELDIHPEPSPVLEKAVAESKIDLAIINVDRANYGNLQYTYLEPDHIVIVGKSNEPRKHKKKIREHKTANLRDFHSDTFLLADNDFLIRRVADEVFKQHHFTPHKVIYTSNIASMINLIAKGSGVAFIPTMLLKSFEEQYGQDSLRIYELENIQLNIPLTLVSLRNSTLSCEIRSFVESVKDEYMNNRQKS